MATTQSAVAERPVAGVRPERVSAEIALWRTVGALLLCLTMLPLYRLLAHEGTGLAGRATVALLDIHYESMWWGSLLILTLAVLGARFAPAARVAFIISATARWLVTRRQPGFAFSLALIAGVLTTAFTLLVLDGKPNHIDSLAQILHARFWSEGRLAGPLADDGFWTIQNGVFTARGWVSQYPPGHVAVLAFFLLLGLPWLSSAVLVGITVFFTSLLADRLLGPVIPARLGSALLAFSTFFLCLAGSYMNHITAAAFVVVGGYAWLRSWQGRLGWATLAGFSFAGAVLTRPLSALVLALVMVFTVPAVVRGRLLTAAGARRLALVALGAAPLLLLLLAYNTYFFGAPFRFGYSVALGPAMSLGFHRDPWGNDYGPLEAAGYTAADLTGLSVNLFETPLPAVLVIGAFLLVCRRLAAGERVLALWAVALLLSNALYWHHGIFMGPRMLHEAAPAWALLFAVAAVGLYRRIDPQLRVRGLHLRTGYASALATSFLIGFALLAPQRAFSYGGQWFAITRTPVPQVDDTALVFVHDGWRSRVAMQLASTGLRLDQVETAIRQNSTCLLQQYIDAHDSGDSSHAQTLLAGIDLTPRAVRLPLTVEVPGGSRLQLWPGETLSAACMRQVRSDRNGTLDVAPLVWQGDLPGTPPGGALFVRDLGPRKNAELIRQHPERRPFVYALSPEGTPTLLPYGAAMQTLWSDN